MLKKTGLLNTSLALTTFGEEQTIDLAWTFSLALRIFVSIAQLFLCLRSSQLDYQFLEDRDQILYMFVLLMACNRISCQWYLSVPSTPCYWGKEPEALLLSQ